MTATYLDTAIITASVKLPASHTFT